MDHTNLTYKNVESLTQTILQQITRDNWLPDYVVGLTRGGLLPAVLISQYLEIPMETLKVSLRDNTESPESNLLIINDACCSKKILIVDDINDSGATLNWIKNNWENTFSSDNGRWANIWNDDRTLPNTQWNQIWGNNVRVAVLIDNLASKCKLDINYSGMEINKQEDPRWVNFPYENWWMK